MLKASKLPQPTFNEKVQTSGTASPCQGTRGRAPHTDYMVRSSWSVRIKMFSTRELGLSGDSLSNRPLVAVPLFLAVCGSLGAAPESEPSSMFTRSYLLPLGGLHGSYLSVAYSEEANVTRLVASSVRMWKATPRRVSSQMRRLTGISLVRVSEEPLH